MEQVHLQFIVFFNYLQLRCWISGTSESDYRDEFEDVVEMVSTMPALRVTPLLFHPFKFSCLCLADNSVPLPVAKFQGANKSDPRCRLSGVFRPAQHSNTLPTCMIQCQSARYRNLEVLFSSGKVAGDFWSYVDSFGQSKSNETILLI